MKKLRLIPVAFAVSLLIFMSACAPKGPAEKPFEKEQHFRNLQFSETPWDSIKGIYKISAEEAQAINNYTFLYDDSLRLVQVNYGRGDSLLDKSSFGAAKMLISYEPQKEVRHYFDKNLQPKKVNGEVFKAVYDLDASGIRIGLKFYGEDGEAIENRNNIAYYIWSKTADGMVKENRFTLADEETVLNPFCPFYELRFSYDKNGRVVRMANYMADTLYDCTVENCGDIGVSYFAFKFNENNALLEFSVHSSTDQLSNLYWGWAKFVTQVNENGYVVERAMYDQDNELLGGKKVPVYQYVYDNSGSVLEQKFMDANRQLMNNPQDTVATRQFKYDDFGNRTETIELDKEGVVKKI